MTCAKDCQLQILFFCFHNNYMYMYLTHHDTHYKWYLHMYNTCVYMYMYTCAFNRSLTLSIHCWTPTIIPLPNTLPFLLRACKIMYILHEHNYMYMYMYILYHHERGPTTNIIIGPLQILLSAHPPLWAQFRLGQKFTRIYAHIILYWSIVAIPEHACMIIIKWVWLRELNHFFKAETWHKLN